MEHDTPHGHDQAIEAKPIRRDGLAAMAVILLTVALIVLVVSSLV